MNYFDLIIIAVMIWSFYSGFKKGLVYMLVSFLAIIAGLYAAIHFSYMLVEQLAGWLDKDPEQLKILSYILTFVIVFALMHLTGKILNKFMDAIALGLMNRLAGGAIGVGINIIVLSLALWLFEQGNQIYPVVKQETMDESRFFHPVKNLSPVILVNLKKLKNNKTLKKIQEKNEFLKQKTDSIQ